MSGITRNLLHVRQRIADAVAASSWKQQVLYYLNFPLLIRLG
jgi:hypothetical protein